MARVWMVVAWLCVGGAVGAAEDSAIHLGVGSQKVLTIAQVTRVAVGSPDVAEVKAVGNNQILITGAGEGRTTLVIWKASGQRVNYVVTVRRQDPNELLAEVRQSLGAMEGIAVRLVGDRVVLDGQAYTSEESDRIDQVLNLYPGVKSFVKVATHAKRLAAQNLTTLFQKAGLKDIQVSVVGATLFLEGSVESPQELQKADLLIKAVGEKVENLISVGLKRMILSEVQFVEIRRQAKDRYGIKYPTDVAGTVSSSLDLRGGLLENAVPWEGEFSSRVVGSSQLAAGFQANDGNARLLAQPKLVCASGEKAEFLAGGEIPIPLLTNNQYTVQYKEYGIILRIKPTADRSGNIQTEIEAEASEVDTSVAVSVGSSVAVPGFRTRKVKTNVTVRHGETIVLSGVFSHDEQKAVSKIPGLGHLPIIGELFKNRGMDNQKRELVIFVTPRLINAESEKNQSLINDATQEYQKAQNEVKLHVLD